MLCSRDSMPHSREREKPSHLLGVGHDGGVRFGFCLLRNIQIPEGQGRLSSTTRRHPDQALPT